MDPVLIPLGYHCNVTYLLQELGIKKETSLFEWLESKRLQYITDVLNVIREGIDEEIITGEDYNIKIIDQYLYTYHYKIAEYKQIFKRRALRFLELIRGSQEVLFVRIQTHLAEDVSLEEINSFCSVIKKINPSLKIGFLLINTVFRGDELNEIDPECVNGGTLIQKYFYYEDCKKDVYLRDNPFIKSLFLKYLVEAGYRDYDRVYYTLNDKE